MMKRSRSGVATAAAVLWMASACGQAADPGDDGGGAAGEGSSSSGGGQGSSSTGGGTASSGGAGSSGGASSGGSSSGGVGVDAGTKDAAAARDVNADAAKDATASSSSSSSSGGRSSSSSSGGSSSSSSSSGGSRAARAAAPAAARPTARRRPPRARSQSWAAVAGTIAGATVTTTTGGGSATPNVVTSASAFTSAVGGTSPGVVYVNGNLNGSVAIGSNKTIVGICGATFTGHLDLSRSVNVIVRNLTIVGFNCKDADAVAAGAVLVGRRRRDDRQQRAPHLVRPRRHLGRLGREPRHDRGLRLRDHLVDEVPLLEPPRRPPRRV